MREKSKKKNTRRIIIGLLAISIVILGMGRVLRQRGGSYTEITVEQDSITTFYSFSGSVEAKNRQAVLADRIMQIKEILVEEGQMVNDGDVLLTTTAGEEIKAKINGEISKIHVEENAQLMAASRLIDIVDFSHLQLRFQVDEYDLHAVESEEEVTVTIHALAKDYSGRISEVSKEGTYLNGVTFFNALVSFENDDLIRVGMSAEAKILNEKAENTTVIPMTAIQFDNNNNPYLLIKGETGTVSRIDIEVGIHDGVKAEVVSGVMVGDIILVPQSSGSPMDFRTGGIFRGSNRNRTVGGS